MKKAEVLKIVKSKGYTVPCGEGSCGDGRLGSRLYFKTEDAKDNDAGVPYLHFTAVVSKVGKNWDFMEYQKR